MRVDSIGIFWEDVKKQRQRGVQDRPAAVMPAIPETDWRPKGFPDLSSAKIIGVDTETCDPTLKERGCGAFRDGYVVGISIATDDGFRAYYPVAHSIKDEPSRWNMDAEAVFDWLRVQLGRDHQMKVGANLLYDLEYLAANDIEVKGPLADVLIAEPLLDENQWQYSLETVAQKHLGAGKVDEELYVWASRAYGGAPTRKSQAGNIWRSPVELVGPYAEADADLPIKILQKQLAELQRQNLMPVFELESKLIRVMLAMRLRGVRMDLDHANKLRDEFEQSRLIAQSNLDKLAGYPVGVNIDDDLVRLFEKNGMEVPRTAKGNPSFEKGGLKNLMKHGNPTEREIARCILAVRKHEKSIGTFLDGYIFGLNHNGRLHANFHQLKSDDGGTVSGRFSSSNPNLQNIPSRDPDQKRIRQCFVPEEGEQWVKDDYSSIEPRYLMHFARGPGAREMRAKYQQNPRFDFYQGAAEAAQIDRTPAKTVALGDMYGQGLDTLAGLLLTDREEAKRIKAIMNDANPYIRETFNEVMRVVQSRGHIFTISGRRRRWNVWCPSDWDLRSAILPTEDREEVVAFVQDEIQRAIQLRKDGVKVHGKTPKIPRPGVERAFTHKGLNALLQGSSADHMKKAMVDIYEAGCMDILGAPLLTVHDELDWSANLHNREHLEAMGEVKHLMESAYELRVPVIVDREVGNNWLDISEERWNDFAN